MITMCMIILPAATVPEERYALLRLRASAGPRLGSAGPFRRRHDGGVRHGKSGPYSAGDVVDVLVGEAVHGGWCVARPGAPEGAGAGGGSGHPGQPGGG